MVEGTLTTKGGSGINANRQGELMGGDFRMAAEDAASACPVN